METFFMFGKYTQESIKGISTERTEKAVSIIKKYGGELKSAYALLGENDLVLIIDFPDIKAAFKTSLDLNKLTGISFSTFPALQVEQFDKIATEI